ncbi:hypothetical protein BGP77_00480 [Saccharospirillum sp. MSK14-1]|uniref:hypothetical protein n=1 Tax=Saccharospirillum sp. MSK14-1 TaxID=1897632 RepID=UPI000D3B6090|nr:hypothetical protein [Saccharospirillum sp. MSK14-1]PTY35840.1 hypothetical protein BGP77_00480 [Saccharospirillum sp. MSK14-1]
MKSARWLTVLLLTLAQFAGAKVVLAASEVEGCWLYPEHIPVMPIVGGEWQFNGLTRAGIDVQEDELYYTEVGHAFKADMGLIAKIPWVDLCARATWGVMTSGYHELNESDVRLNAKTVEIGLRYYRDEIFWLGADWVYHYDLVHRYDSGNVGSGDGLNDVSRAYDEGFGWNLRVGGGPGWIGLNHVFYESDVAKNYGVSRLSLGMDLPAILLPGLIIGIGQLMMPEW